VECLGINVSDLLQIQIKLRLVGVDSLGELFVERGIGLPEGVLLDLVPSDTLDGVFFQEFGDEIVELRAETLQSRSILLHNHSDQIFEQSGIKRGFPGGHLNDDTP
jgi:hypothetical protein